MRLGAGRRAAGEGYHQAAALRAAGGADTASHLPAAVVAATRAFDSTLAQVGGDPEGGRGGGGGFFGGRAPPAPPFLSVNAELLCPIHAPQKGRTSPPPALPAAYRPRR